MSSNNQRDHWTAALRRVFPWLGRERHYASISEPSAVAPKLKPIKKIVADAGRSAGTPAD